jgi:hypothetical protein
MQTIVDDRSRSVYASSSDRIKALQDAMVKLLTDPTAHTYEDGGW